MQCLVKMFTILCLFIIKACTTTNRTQHMSVEEKEVLPNVSDNDRYVPIDSFYLIKHQLSGDWVWLKTQCCGRIVNINTPESTKTTIEKKFSTDGTIYNIENGRTIGTSGYQIIKSYLSDDRYMISIDDGRPGFLYILGDTLIIDYSYVDLQTEWYLRKRK